MKGIIYYTDNRLPEPLFSLAQRHILAAGLPIVSASLKPMAFGENAVIEGERSYPTMVKQIISCLERSTADWVWFCEHDCLYHPSHFAFEPDERDDCEVFWYNANVWRWWLGADMAIRHDRMLPLSVMCAFREFALEHYRRRLARIHEMGWSEIRSREPRWARLIGYEPGTKKIKRGGFSDDDFSVWDSEYPVIDVRHRGTFSSPKIRREDFRHPPEGWEEIPVEDVPGWDLRRLLAA